jgi:hypothetical protein
VAKGSAAAAAETTETRRIGTTYVVDGNGESTAAAPDDDQEAAYSEFASLSDQERSGINVRVYQVPHDERGQAMQHAKLIWLMCEPIDKYTKDELCRVIQRGFFEPDQKLMWVRLMIYKEGERGIRRNLLFPLHAAPKAQAAEAEQSRSQVADILAMVARMNAEAAQRQETFFQRLAESRAAPPPPPDPMGMMRDTVALLTPLLVAATGGRAAAADPMAQLGGMITTMRQVKSLGDELSGKGGGEPGEGGGVVDVIKALVPLAQPALEIAAGLARNRQPAAPQPAPVAPPPPAIAAAPAPAPAAQPEPQSVDIQQILKLKELLGRAADLDGKADPATVAAQILAEIPESMDDEVYARLSDANWFQGLQALEPKVAGKQAYFTQIREYILKQFSPLPEVPEK